MWVKSCTDYACYWYYYETDPRVETRERSVYGYHKEDTTQAYTADMYDYEQHGELEIGGYRDYGGEW